MFPKIRDLRLYTTQQDDAAQDDAADGFDKAVVTCLMHRPVDGFGICGDCWVCTRCGLSKYPEVFPENHLPVIKTNSPEWVAEAKKANSAMERRHRL